MTDAEPRYGYHGTPEANRQAIILEGLRADKASGPSPCVWLALSKEEAAHYGVVFEVDLIQLDGTWPKVVDEIDGTPGDLHWQAHVASSIPPQALKLVP